MEIRRLLVADASAEFCDALAAVLGGTYELRICHDGLKAKTLLDSFQPDLLVLDLTLPGLDGIAVLRAAAAAPCRPSILVTTRFLSSYIESAVEALGVDYLMMKPCDLRALADHIHSLSDCGTRVFVPAGPEVSVTNMLLALNVSTKRRGYRYLETAVTLFEQDPGQSVTKSLYPAVAKLCGCSRASVERAIRAAVHCAWERRDEKVWRLYFRPCRDGSVPRPTNTEFIATLAERLRQQSSRKVQ